MVALSASVLEHEQKSYLDVGFDAFIGKPFRTAQVYACLADLLGVEYQYGREETPAGVPAAEVDLRRMALPEELYARLHQAVRLQRVTDVKTFLDEIERLGPEEQRLAAHLRDLAQAYNMKAMRTLLERIPHG